MLFTIINIVLFGLFYANTMLLLDWSVWLGLVGILPVWLARRFFADHELRILSVYTQVSLLIGMTVVVFTVLRSLMLSQPVVERLLLPLLVAVLVLYVLYLYLCWQQTQKPGKIDEQQLTFWVSGPSLLMSFAVAVVCAAYCLFVLSLLGTHTEWWSTVAVKFTTRGIIPPVTLIFFFWALLILISKWVLLSLGLRLFFDSDELGSRLDKLEISRQDCIDQLWQYSSESYLIPKYLNWSIPILGFIGTVLGISLAADGIQSVIASQEGLSQLSNDLGNAIAPLGIAFDTTLIALSLSILLTLFQTLQQRTEDRVMNAITRRLSEQH